MVAVYHQSAHVVQQACGESCLLIQARALGQLAGCGGAANRMPPERIHVQRLAVELFELQGQRRGDDQAAELAHSQNIDRITNGTHPAGQPVERRVRQMQHFDRQSLVQAQRVGDGVQLHLIFLHQHHQLLHHGGQGRQGAHVACEGFAIKLQETGWRDFHGSSIPRYSKSAFFSTWVWPLASRRRNRWRSRCAAGSTASVGCICVPGAGDAASSVVLMGAATGAALGVSGSEGAEWGAMDKG